MIEIRMSRVLHDRMMVDLLRDHPFAAERVGFVYCKHLLSDTGGLVLLTQYQSIPDNQYIDDRRVGARIGTEALTSASTEIYQGRNKCQGVFHVHVHDHYGRTGMSSVDRRELPGLVPGFQSVGPNAAHGIIILSRNHGSGWVWMPAAKEPILASLISVIGSPIDVFRSEAA